MPIVQFANRSINRGLAVSAPGLFPSVPPLGLSVHAPYFHHRRGAWQRVKSGWWPQSLDTKMSHEETYVNWYKLCIFLYIHTWCMHILVGVHIYIYVCVSVYVCINVHVYTYIYTILIYKHLYMCMIGRKETHPNSASRSCLPPLKKDALTNLLQDGFP